MKTSIFEQLRRVSDTQAFANHGFVTGLIENTGDRLDLFCRYINIYRYVNIFSDERETDEELRSRALNYLSKQRIMPKLGSQDGVDFLEISEAMNFVKADFGENPFRLHWLGEVASLTGNFRVFTTRFFQTLIGTYKIQVTSHELKRTWLLPAQEPRVTAEKIEKLVKKYRKLSQSEYLEDVEAHKRYCAYF